MINWKLKWHFQCNNYDSEHFILVLVQWSLISATFPKLFKQQLTVRSEQCDCSVNVALQKHLMKKSNNAQFSVVNALNVTA